MQLWLTQLLLRVEVLLHQAVVTDTASIKGGGAATSGCCGWHSFYQGWRRWYIMLLWLTQPLSRWRHWYIMLLWLLQLLLRVEVLLHCTVMTHTDLTRQHKAPIILLSLLDWSTNSKQSKMVLQLLKSCPINVYTYIYIVLMHWSIFLSVI